MKQTKKYLKKTKKLCLLFCGGVSFRYTEMGGWKGREEDLVLFHNEIELDFKASLFLNWETRAGILQVGPVSGRPETRPLAKFTHGFLQTGRP